MSRSEKESISYSQILQSEVTVKNTNNITEYDACVSIVLAMFNYHQVNFAKLPQEIKTEANKLEQVITKEANQDNMANFMEAIKQWYELLSKDYSPKTKSVKKKKEPTQQNLF